MLEISRPPLAEEANCQGATGARRSDAARAAAAMASTASPTGVGVGASGASIGSRSWASTVNQTRIASALAAKRRSQPRTVEGGTPGPTRPAMAHPGRLGHQRGADHLGQVTATKEAVGADQHMGRLAGAATAPARSTAFNVPAPAHVSPSCRPPGPKLPAAVRARQLAGEKGAFDFHRVRSYDLHQCLRASGRALPSLPSDSREGPCASGRVHAVARREEGQPEGCPHRLQPRCRYAVTRVLS